MNSNNGSDKVFVVVVLMLKESFSLFLFTLAEMVPGTKPSKFVSVSDTGRVLFFSVGSLTSMLLLKSRTRLTLYMKPPISLSA